MPAQKIEPMTAEMIEHAERQRSWVRDHYEDHAKSNYGTIDGKLRLLRTILDARWIEPTETWKLQSLGITFGDALAQHLDLEWVAVEDEYGRSPALRLSGTSILIFPLTAISKRVERGDAVNVDELFAWFCETIVEMRAKGY
jgi:hypothetical protein